LYAPHSAVLDGLNVILSQHEKYSLPLLRRATLKRVYDLILTEDDNTDYQDLGPVNKMMNFIVRWYVDGPESVAFKRHRWRRADFMWLGKEGMMMTGTNGSQLWDIAFIAQAIVESGLATEEPNRASCVKALSGWIRRRSKATPSTMGRISGIRARVLGPSVPLRRVTPLATVLPRA
jgi:lanosterol synthase